MVADAIPCHHCGAPAETQWPRHATAEEAAAHFDALEGNIRTSGNPDYEQDRTGLVHKAVHACGDHTLGPICTHTAPAPQPCPVCHAPAAQPCRTSDGRERPVEHPARADAQPQAETCTHAHDADCGGYGLCRCITVKA